MTISATTQGTTRYAQKFACRAAEGHFRDAQGVIVSSLGIGTYLGALDEKTDQGYTASTIAAVENGINFIDAAINYRFQRSERNIGAALQELMTRGFLRDELVLCTKAGYLTPDGKMPSDAPCPAIWAILIGPPISFVETRPRTISTIPSTIERVITQL